MVSGDNTMGYKGKTFRILPNEYRLSFFKAKVDVHQYLDGSISIFCQEKKLKQKPLSKAKVKFRSHRSKFGPAVIEPNEHRLTITDH